MPKIEFPLIEGRTEQEVYDYVANHLRKQGKRAFDENLSRCQYRVMDPESGNILSCAGGCLVPDEAYDPNWDRFTGGIGVPWDRLSAQGDVPMRHSSFIKALQFLHDDTLSWVNLEYSLREFCVSSDIEYTPPLEKS